MLLSFSGEGSGGGAVLLSFSGEGGGGGGAVLLASDGRGGGGGAVLDTFPIFPMPGGRVPTWLNLAILLIRFNFDILLIRFLVAFETAHAESGLLVSLAAPVEAPSMRVSALAFSCSGVFVG